jgi:protein-disulfide isomerase
MMRTTLVVPLGFLAAFVACRPAPAADAARPAATSAPPSREVVAEVEGVPVTAADLDERIGNRLVRLRQEEYEIRRQALDEIVYDRLLEKEAKKRGVSVKDLVQDEVDRQVPEPDAKVVETIYTQNQARFGAKPREAVLGEIRSALKNQARQQRQVAFAKSLREKSAVKVALEPPRATVPVPASAPTLGPDGAPVTIVQFVDYQCPFCHRAQSTIDQILSRYPGKVQLVHRDFPLDGHPQAMPAARASRCAGEQGKFWDYHRSLMTVKGPMDDADLKSRAAGLKLDPAAFSSCLASDRFDSTIRAAFDEGTRAGVNSTPSYFVNGRMMTGALPFEEFREVVDSELERSR